MLDPESAGIDKSKQMIVIDAMADETKGDNTWGKGPVAQRIGYINGDQYTRSILNNPENYYPGYNETSYSYRAVDYVWEYPDNNSNGAGVENWNGYTVGSQVTEIIEHVLHTICQYGLPYAYPDELSIFNGNNGPVMAAMQEAISNGVFDVSSYSAQNDGSNQYFALIAREYQYLLIFAMWEYITVYIDGGSLSPEWNDNSRTQAGVQTNNPLGYALYNNFISKVISKPTQATLDAMFAVSGASGYIPVENTNRILYTPFNNKDTLTVGDLAGSGTVIVSNK